MNSELKILTNKNKRREDEEGEAVLQASSFVNQEEASLEKTQIVRSRFFHVNAHSSANQSPASVNGYR